MKKMILLAVVLMLATSCGGQTNQTVETPTPTPTPTTVLKATNENISVNIEKQDITEKGRKVVVWVENLIEYTVFDGEIHIHGDGKLIDTIFLEDLEAYTKTYGIIFDKSYASEYTYNISGSLKEVEEDGSATEAKPATDIEYNQFYQQNNPAGKWLYIQTPDDSTEYVVSVCKAVKAKYPKGEVYIHFYRAGDNVVQNKPPYETGAPQSFAHLMGDTIIFYDTDELIKIE